MSRRLLSSSEHTFEQGDRALLVFIKKHRKLIIPVLVAKVAHLYNYATLTSAAPTHAIVGYTVSSGYGGELRVSPNVLLPDTILDRINAELNTADELRRRPH